MIPIRLQLKNFMSYGANVPPLDFTGVRLACLSGDNGNGKTALLDAITWALFGETRAPSEDDVVRLGQSDVAVLFDFEVEQQRYRVHRARGKRGGAVWELQAWQEDGSLRSLSGTVARETKARIERLLRMDYRTFLATAYLAQGQADTFARAGVNDRKKILADILDLSRYDRLEEMTRERHKAAREREIDAEREIAAMDAELEHEDRYADLLDKAKERLASAATEIAQRQAVCDRVFAQIERMEAQEEKAREWEARIPEIEEELAESRAELSQIVERVAAADAILARREMIEANHRRFVHLDQRIGPLMRQADEYFALQRAAHELQRTIDEAQRALDNERYRLEREITDREREGADLAKVEAEIERLEAHIAPFHDLETRWARLTEQREGVEQERFDRKSEHAAFQAQAAQIEKRRAALASSDASDCEYCGQPLPAARRQESLAEAEAEIARLNEQMARCLAAAHDLKRQAELRRQDEIKLKDEQQQAARLKERLNLVRQEQLRLSERLKALPEEKRRLARCQKQITERDFARDEQERLVQVSAECEKRERVREELAAAQAERDQLSGSEREKLHLESATQTLKTDPPRADEIRKRIEKREASIAKARLQILQIRTATAALPQLRREQQEANIAVTTAQNAARESEREIGQYTAAIARCHQLRVERGRRDEERKAASREKDLYKELVGAFGKKGVQALIIENALPEIQETANEILGRMTQGAMQVQLITQREAKSKTAGMIETLDIVISDDMGTRPYEMYSGGEAFRINFALRIALSRMLARRAGAPLQTLIMDEGFGTQDPRGREAIIEALHTVSEEFALVLVITHVEELKESFPTRIEVIKGPDGSTFTIQ